MNDREGEEVGLWARCKGRHSRFAVRTLTMSSGFEPRAMLISVHSFQSFGIELSSQCASIHTKAP